MIDCKYAKPSEICKDLSNWEIELQQLDNLSFVESYKAKIKDSIRLRGYSLRYATEKDLGPLDTFIKTHFPPYMLYDVSIYSMYYLIKYGSGILIETPDNQIVGCAFEIGFRTDDATSYSIRLGVHKKHTGKGFGKALSLFTYLIGMEKGSNIKKGLIDYNNYINLYLQLNKLGWFLSEFHGDLYGLGNSFTGCMPLTKDGILKNIVDNQKLLDFIQNNKPEKDYILIDCDDIDKIAEVYEETCYKIIAFVRANQIGPNHQLLAMPMNQF